MRERKPIAASVPIIALTAARWGTVFTGYLVGIPALTHHQL
jgi:hypothetical protein